MKNLTSIAEHSDYLSRCKYNDQERWIFHRNRINFGKQPLELWMFVPCDEDGNVLENKFYPSSMSFSNDANIYREKYQQAKERCLFEGFVLNDADWCDETMVEITNESNKCLLDYCVETKTLSFVYEEEFIPTIEDLVKYNLILTNTAEKQIGYEL